MEGKGKQEGGEEIYQDDRITYGELHRPALEDDLLPLQQLFFPRNLNIEINLRFELDI